MPDWLIAIGIILALAACGLGVLYFWLGKKGSP